MAKPEITFKLGRIEELKDCDKKKVEGWTKDMKEGLVIKEYRSGSFVKLRRFVPMQNLFASQVSSELTPKNRETISEVINSSLKF